MRHEKLDRRELLRRLGAAGGGALVLRAAAGLGIATSLEARTTDGIPPRAGAGRHVVVLGAGVGGLAAAYELLRKDFRCTVLEANPRVGGRSLTLRHGDTLTEDPLEPYADTGQTSSTQTCLFGPAGARGYDRPYLNAGPGRIPSSHTHVLTYCRRLKVPLEVYVMESRSNLVRGNPSLATRVNRHVASDARGRIAEALFELAAMVPNVDRNQLENLLIVFGALGDGQTGTRGVYAENGRYQQPHRARAGYARLPGVEEGVLVEPMSFQEVLDAQLERTSFYQPEDFHWQPTLFQPVGGMDRIVKQLARKVEKLGGEIVLDAEVDSLRYDGGTQQWIVRHRGDSQTLAADACISNIPIPLLQGPLGSLGPQPFGASFRAALQTIFRMEATGTRGFLAPTCKVGWQAERDLWQKPDPSAGRVVPIFGGISWTSAAMTQLWYPSDRIFDKLGVLTGAYNFANSATNWGRNSPAWRLVQAKDEATALAGAKFGAGLNPSPNDGVGLSIAWQNMKFQRGGWAQWENVPDGTATYNALLAGDPGSGFFLCGDQLSQLPGWQEGAIVSALHAVNALADPAFRPVAARSVPDSRIVVEGRLDIPMDR